MKEEDIDSGNNAKDEPGYGPNGAVPAMRERKGWESTKREREREMLSHMWPTHACPARPRTRIALTHLKSLSTNDGKGRLHAAL